MMNYDTNIAFFLSLYVNQMLMQTRLFCIVLMFVGLSLFSSCASYRDIEVKDLTVDNIIMQGSKIIVDFSATVRNPNRAFVLQSAEGELSNGKQLFASAQMLRTISVPAKSEQRCSGQLELTILNLLSAFQMGLDYRSWDLSSFLFTGEMKVKSGSVKKKFEYKEVPVGQLINSL